MCVYREFCVQLLGGGIKKYATESLNCALSLPLSKSLQILKTTDIRYIMFYI